jgi:hypothetical protein
MVSISAMVLGNFAAEVREDLARRAYQRLGLVVEESRGTDGDAQAPPGWPMQSPGCGIFLETGRASLR